jgi:hypothetical protein
MLMRAVGLLIVVVVEEVVLLLLLLLLLREWPVMTIRDAHTYSNFSPLPLGKEWMVMEEMAVEEMFVEE